MKIVNELRGDSAVDGTRFHFARAGSLDLHFAIDRRRAGLARHAARRDASVHGAQVDGDRFRHLELVVDPNIVDPEDVKATFSVAADDERVALNVGFEITLILGPRVRRLSARSNVCHQFDFVRRRGLNGDRAVNLAHLEAMNRRRRPAAHDANLSPLAPHEAAGRQQSDGERIDDSLPAVHDETLQQPFTSMRGKGFGRMSSTSQTTLLRVAAFLVDTLSLSVILVLPASLISYTLALVGGSVKGISIV